MLAEETIKIIKSTAPVLAEHGELLTRHFYKRMFEHNPEVKHLFNTSNQNGMQQRALAAAITAYAANIDNLAVLGGAVKMITQKHASLQIKPEHYPIVGENLLAAIKEVFGDAINDDILNAWGEAYNFLANILIQEEQKIYEANANKKGGWHGFKKFRIINKVQESSIITSFYLVPADNNPLPDYLAGQYITVRIPTSDGSTTMRHYSLSQKPNNSSLRISVKREEAPASETQAGYVSNYLHDKIEIDDEVEIAPPCGEFILNTQAKDNKPLVFIAAGVGITPILSMLETAVDLYPNRNIILIHAVRDKHVQPFSESIKELSSQHKNLKTYYRYSDIPQNTSLEDKNQSIGFIDEDFLNLSVPKKDAEYYFCGPHHFMKAIFAILNKWEVPQPQIKFELFGPQQSLESK